MAVLRSVALRFRSLSPAFGRRRVAARARLGAGVVAGVVLVATAGCGGGARVASPVASTAPSTIDDHIPQAAPAPTPDPVGLARLDRLVVELERTRAADDTADLTYAGEPGDVAALSAAIVPALERRLDALAALRREVSRDRQVDLAVRAPLDAGSDMLQQRLADYADRLDTLNDDHLVPSTTVPPAGSPVSSTEASGASGDPGTGSAPPTTRSQPDAAEAIAMLRTVRDLHVGRDWFGVVRSVMAARAAAASARMLGRADLVAEADAIAAEAAAVPPAPTRDDVDGEGRRATIDALTRRIQALAHTLASLPVPTTAN